jgi:hypothetical protein
MAQMLHLTVSLPSSLGGSGAALVILAIILVLVSVIRWFARRAHVVVLIDGKNIVFMVVALFLLACLITLGAI